MSVLAAVLVAIGSAGPAQAAKASQISGCTSRADGAAPTNVTVTFTGGATGQYYSLRWTDPSGSLHATLFGIGPDYTGTGQTGFVADVAGAYAVSITSAAPNGGKAYARCPVTVS